jgi:uncharacterized damage-inducible protein DinB
MKRLLVVVLLAASTSPALAQGAAAASGATGSAATASKFTYDIVKGYILRAAEQMPEADYAFKATPDVRSFGQLVGHVANANYSICSGALNEQSPSSENIEQARTTKAALVEALQASFAYCDRAYAQSAEEAARSARSLMGQTATRDTWLTFNAAHDFEHYGNMVTYMRLKGMTPPSSQRSGGNQ